MQFHEPNDEISCFMQICVIGIANQKNFKYAFTQTRSCQMLEPFWLMANSLIWPSNAICNKSLRKSQCKYLPMTAGSFKNRAFCQRFFFRSSLFLLKQWKKMAVRMIQRSRAAVFVLFVSLCVCCGMACCCYCCTASGVNKVNDRKSVTDIEMRFAWLWIRDFIMCTSVSQPHNL